MSNQIHKLAYHTHTLAPICAEHATLPTITRSLLSYEQLELDKFVCD